MSSALMVVFALMSLSAQAQGGQQRVIAAPKGPTPHLSDGKPDLSGVWRGGGPVQDLAVGLTKGETIPLLPEAEKLMKSRQSKDDPEANCRSEERRVGKECRSWRWRCEDIRRTSRE